MAINQGVPVVARARVGGARATSFLAAHSLKRIRKNTRRRKTRQRQRRAGGIPSPKTPSCRPPDLFGGHRGQSPLYNIPLINRFVRKRFALVSKFRTIQYSGHDWPTTQTVLPTTTPLFYQTGGGSWAGHRPRRNA